VPRRWARIQNKDGSSLKVSRRIALRLLDSGDYRLIRRLPLVIGEILPYNYLEEKRHLTGRVVPGCTRTGLNGRYSIRRGRRAVVPRRSLDKDAQEANRWLDQERIKIIEAQKAVVHEVAQRRRSTAPHLKKGRGSRGHGKRGAKTKVSTLE